jgi:AbiV family abortive infection protein
MSSLATPVFLVEGAAYSLEQSGFFLRDAELLFSAESYANCVVLAAFAWEALGQWNILLDLRRQVLSGAEIPINKLKTLYDDHELKQRAGMSSINLMGAHDTGVGKIILSRIMSLPGSDEAVKTDAALQELIKSKLKRVPQVRHNLRKLAMYVDPVGSGWSRPSMQVSREAARQFFEEARNDYARAYLNGYTNFQGDTDSELFNALNQWGDRPTLPPPPGPLPLDTPG